MPAFLVHREDRYRKNIVALFPVSALFPDGECFVFYRVMSMYVGADKNKIIPHLLVL